MSLSADALYRMSDVDLLAAYAEVRRQFVEKKFTRDTHRARLVSRFQHSHHSAAGSFANVRTNGTLANI
jgi:hypothetical protein